jgi:hypothetical protein
MRFDRFRTRRVPPLGLFEHHGWRLKTYGIGLGDTTPREELRGIAPNRRVRGFRSPAASPERKARSRTTCPGPQGAAGQPIR